MATPIDPHYIEARAVLLDALDALAPFREAVILVGAQAVYVHTQAVDSDFAVSPFTFDADLALDPELLIGQPGAIQPPLITEAMQAAGFTLTGQPGIYKRGLGGGERTRQQRGATRYPRESGR